MLYNNMWKNWNQITPEYTQRFIKRKPILDIADKD